jgi:chemotaxis protein MotB
VLRASAWQLQTDAVMRIIQTIAVLFALTGCVSQGSYDDLKRNYDAAQGKVAVDTSTIAALEESLDAAQRKLAAIESEAARAKEALTALQNVYDASLTQQVALTGELSKHREQLAELLKDKSRLRETTLELQEALADLWRRKAQADRRVAEARGLLARFKPLIDAGTLRVTIDAGRMVLSLPTDVLFDTGSARLSKVGKQAVTEVALVLGEDFANRHFQVEGHTDDVPIHNESYASNWELASARALGVVKVMVAEGVAASSLSAASHGEHRPAKPNDGPANRAYNRRIEIILVPDMTSLPGFEELKSAVDRS